MERQVVKRAIGLAALALLVAACTTNRPPPPDQRESSVQGNYSQNVIERPVYTGQ